MTCTFALPKPLESSRPAKLREGTSGWWARWLRITDPAQLDDEAQAWIRGSYRLTGWQERLLNRQTPIGDDN